MTGDRLLTTAEAAEYLGIKAQTLTQWRHEGRNTDLIYLQVGERSIRYRKTDLDEWLQSRMVGGHRE